jgi:nucleotide-binding universal stress UspA family protein
MRREEKERMERELYERNAFMPNLERILLAVDGGANGRFASRLAGLLAGARGMPVTLLDVAANGKKLPETRPEADVIQPVVAAAEEAGAKKQAVPEIDVIVRKHDVSPAEAIATEAERGYDLLLVGIEEVATKGGSFHPALSRLVSQFEGSVAIVDARGVHREDPAASMGKVLIPVTGNENARRGAEVAITLAHSLHADVSTLSVVGKAARNRRAVRREIQAVTDEIKRVGKYLGAKIKTSVRTDDDAGGAILRASERDKSDLVAMGVSRRPGDRLSFGDMADTLLRDAKCSLLFIAPQARAAAKSAPKGPEKAAASSE